MTDNFGFISDTSAPSKDFGFIPYQKVQERAKGIGETSRTAEEENRSQKALEQLFKGIPVGSYKTLRALSGSRRLGDPEKLQHFIETREVAPSSEERLESLLGLEEPTYPEQKIVRRIGETAGSLPFLGVSPRAAVPLLTGSAAGGAAEVATGSPLAGDITELVTGLGGGALKGGAKFSPSFESLASRARRLGFSDKELSALSHSAGKTKFFAKKASKGSRAASLQDSITQAFDTAYNTLSQEASGLPPLNKASEGRLLSEVNNVLSDLKKTVKASPDKESAIKYLEESLDNIFENGATPEELLNWYQDVNSVINWKAVKGGKKQLAAIKKPIQEALESSSPDLAQDFRVINDLYSKNAQLYQSLKPNQIEIFLNKLQLPAAAIGILSGHPSVLYEVFGRAAAKRLSFEILSNPRLQGTQRKLFQSIKDGRFQQARKLADRIYSMYEKNGSTSNESREEELPLV